MGQTTSGTMGKFLNKKSVMTFHFCRLGICLLMKIFTVAFDFVVLFK